MLRSTAQAVTEKSTLIFNYNRRKIISTRNNSQQLYNTNQACLCVIVTKSEKRGS